MFVHNRILLLLQQTEAIWLNYNVPCLIYDMNRADSQKQITLLYLSMSMQFLARDVYGIDCSNNSNTSDSTPWLQLLTMYLHNTLMQYFLFSYWRLYSSGSRG